MNQLRSFVFAFLFYLVLVIETQPQFRVMSIGGVTPDLALVMLTVYGIERGALRGAFVGLAVGLIRDAASAAPPGTHAMIGAIAGYLAGKLGWRIYKGHISSQVFTVVLVAVVAHTVQFLVDTGGNFPGTLRSAPVAIILQAIYSGLAAPPFFWGGGLLLERGRRLDAN